jgi:hypothetical protein
MEKCETQVRIVAEKWPSAYARSGGPIIAPETQVAPQHCETWGRIVEPNSWVPLNPLQK